MQHRVGGAAQGHIAGQGVADGAFVDDLAGGHIVLDQIHDGHTGIEKKSRRCNNMSNSNSSNKVSVPEAKEAMNRFKQEVASELGVPLKEGYNGDLTSRQAGSIGGEMVKKMIMKQEEQMSNK